MFIAKKETSDHLLEVLNMLKSAFNNPQVIYQIIYYKKNNLNSFLLILISINLGGVYYQNCNEMGKR